MSLRGRERQRHTDPATISHTRFLHRVLQHHGNVETQGLEEEDDADEPRVGSGICDGKEGTLGCMKVQGHREQVFWGVCEDGEVDRGQVTESLYIQQCLTFH